MEKKQNKTKQIMCRNILYKNNVYVIGFFNTQPGR